MPEQIRSAELLVKTAISDPATLDELRKSPEEALKKLETQIVKQLPRVLDQDKWIYRIVVGSLSLVVLSVVLGAIFLSAKVSTGDVKIPDILTALGSAAVGALAGLLAPSPAGRS